MTSTKIYKDYFEVTNYLETDNIDFIFRKSVISEHHLYKEKGNSVITSFEKYNAEKVLGLYNFLKYKLYFEKDAALQEWLKKNINFFNNVLFNIKKDKTFITPEYAFIHQKYEHMPYNNNGKIMGRLYSLTSMHTLPKEMRYYMFKDDYVYYDMQNSQPFILYTYSKNNKLDLNGSLESYVMNRPAVMQEIYSEMCSNSTVDFDLGEVKQKVLMLLNKTWDESETPKSEIFNLLDEDFQTIRNHLWESHCEIGSSPYTKDMINVKKFDLFDEIDVQTFYCRTQETLELKRLTSFLKEQYKNFTDKDNNYKFTDYYPYTDKKVNLDASYTLFIVPFFDGLYISSPSETFMEELPKLIWKYIFFNEGAVFVQKNIEKHKSSIQNTNELKKFMVIQSWLAKSSSQNDLDNLITKTDLNEQASKLVVTRDNKEDIDDSWVNDYKNKIDYVKMSVYKILLEHPIKSHSDIKEIIKELIK